MKYTDFVEKPCNYCFGYGVWKDGTPMGPLDAQEMPSYPCPKCGEPKRDVHPLDWRKNQ